MTVQLAPVLSDKQTVVYTQDNCPACETTKRKLITNGVEHIVKKIGTDISREEFFKKYPAVRSVPFVTYE